MPQDACHHVEVLELPLQVLADRSDSKARVWAHHAEATCVAVARPLAASKCCMWSSTWQHRRDSTEKELKGSNTHKPELG